MSTSTDSIFSWLTGFFKIYLPLVFLNSFGMYLIIQLVQKMYPLRSLILISSQQKQRCWQSWEFFFCVLSISTVYYYLITKIRILVFMWQCFKWRLVIGKSIPQLDNIFTIFSLLIIKLSLNGFSTVLRQKQGCVVCT